MKKLFKNALYVVVILLVNLMLSNISFAVEYGDLTKPKNDVPLVIIRVDESDEGIQNARDKDSKHEYGNIEQMHESMDHSVRCVGTFEIILPDGYVSEYESSTIPSGQVNLEYIRGRGNSTWTKPKKPYKIKFEEKQEILGMGKNKEWGLLANSFDSTLANNAISMYLGKEFGIEFSIQMVPVELVMIGANGEEYLGSYYLSELINIGKSRIDIGELGKNETENITGGYLLSLYYEDQDSNEPESTVFETDISKIKFINKNPEFVGELTEGQSAQMEYIRNYINQIDSLIMNNDVITQDIHNQIDSLMDLRSTAKYWLIQEFLINFDSYKTSSNYLYKKSDGKLYWGPLWDYDLIYYLYDKDQVEQFIGFNTSKPFEWLDRLRMNDPAFVQLIIEEWENLNDVILQITQQGGIIDQYKERGRATWQDNYDLWAEELFFDGVDYDEEFEKLRNLMEFRRNWFNENIENAGKVYFTLSFKVDDEIVAQEIVRGHFNPETIDVIPEKEGYIFKDWINEKTGERFGWELIESDITYIATFVKEDEIDKNIDMYFSKYEAWVPLEWEEYYDVYYIIYPEEQQEIIANTIKWTSSDETIATIEKGTVKLHSPGDVTITATLFNGLSRSYLLHVCDENEEYANDITELVVDKDKFNIEVGKTGQITYKILPESIDPNIYISISTDVSDPDIIQMDYSSCLSFIGLKEGKTIVTLTVENWDTETVFTKDIEVTVSKKQTSSGGTQKPSTDTKWSKVDNWAKEEMIEADKKELIPEILVNKDFTTNISRNDFVAVAVKLYELLTGEKAEKAKINPFTDTDDEYVLKAYNLGITNGISDTEFGNLTITREQMATMIARALKKAGINIDIDLDTATLFADDNQMHEWSKEAIYFMAQKEIIKGVGDNRFNTLANAKIEEAIAIVLRCAKVYGK